MLRLCQINDCRDIWQINQEELNYNVPFEVVEKQLLKILQDPNQQIYVYESDKRVVGYVHASKYDLLYAPPLITILGIAVLKEYQRNGIGGLLLLMVEDWANDCGISGVQLNAGVNREIAHKFYEAWGYECRKEQLNFVKMLVD
mgnify:FL=1